MLDLTLSFVPAGHELHFADLAGLKTRGHAIPHTYASWPLNDSSADWLWCRAADRTCKLIACFTVALSASRAIPGMRIGRVERLGRTLHEAATPVLGRILAATAMQIPRLLQLDIQVFDEDAERRHRLGTSIEQAGGRQLLVPRSYPRTIALDLLESDNACLSSLTYGARRKIRLFDFRKDLVVRAISELRYESRLEELYFASFRRTGSRPPPIQFSDVMNDAASETSSILLGVFFTPRKPPYDLVSFAWGRLQGDHVSYDASASERSEEIRGIPLGYPLIWQLARWARARGATWFDLGGILPSETDSSHPLYGISRFKRQFSSRELEIATEYRIQPRPRLSRIANRFRSLLSSRTAER